MATIKVLLTDPQDLSRQGMTSFMEQVKDVEVVDEAFTRNELFEKLSYHQPTLVIFDYNYPEHFDVNDISKIHSVSPETKIIVISADQEKKNIQKVFSLGVHCFLTKECGKAEILDAIDSTIKGEKFVCQRVLDILLEGQIEHEETCDPAILSLREIEVVRLISEGLTTKEIAAKLFLSHHTINAHRKNILKKLNAKSASEVVRFAMDSGLVSSKGY